MLSQTKSLRLQHFFQQHQHTTFLNKGSFYTEIQEHQSKDLDHSAEWLKKRYNAHVFLTSLLHAELRFKPDRPPDPTGLRYFLVTTLR